MRSKFLTSIAAAATAAILTGCSVTGVNVASTVSSTAAGVTTTATATKLSTDATITQARASNAAVEAADTSYDASSATNVALNGSTATASGAGVTVDGSTVTITQPGTYVLSGSLAGQVVVNSAADGEVKIVLDNASITSSTGAALSVTDADTVAVILASGSTNTLADTAGYADTTSENAANAALFSTADLTIGGDGALTVTGQYNDGIASKDGLVITGGTIKVTAVDDGIRGKDYVAVTGGTITVAAGGDALKSDNTSDADAGFVDISGGTLTLSAGTKAGDGIDAVNDIIVVDGAVTVTQSYEGLEALNIVIGGGTTEVTSSDDGVNVSETKDETSTSTSQQQGPGGGGGDAVIGGTLSISGGALTVHAGGDGLDSNGNASISGGTVVVDQTGGGNGALDVNGTFKITGGTLISLGSNSMPEAPDADSSQGWISANVSGSAGSTVTISAGGTTIATFKATRAFGNLVYSSADVKSGSSYAVGIDGTSTTVTAGQAVSGQMGGRGGH